MSYFKVIDNFLPDDQANHIEEVLMGSNIPWYSGSAISSEEYTTDKNGNIISDPETVERTNQFWHVFYQDMQPNSNFFQTIVPIIQKINPSALMRVKANLHWKGDRLMQTGYHVDSLENSLSAIYYVNTNNGLTIFEDGSKINSVKNRLLVFKSSKKHTGTNCTDANFRCIVNTIFHKSIYGIK